MIGKDEKGVLSDQHIHDDLTFSILSKLPLKSLKRFGCCCKSWGFLLESPVFMSMYRNNFISNNYYDDTSVVLLNHLPPFSMENEFNSTLYLLSGERFENKVKLDWPPLLHENVNDIRMLSNDSINGFVLFQQQTTIVLWNLTTDEFKVIPPSLVEFESPYRETSIIFHGFGYDHVRDDYKVIQRVHFFDLIDSDFDRLGVLYEEVSWEDVSLHPLWEIYSLRNNSWSRLDVNVADCCHQIPGYQVYVDGMCHWRGHEGIPQEECLVSFDLSNQVFFTTPMPLDMDDMRAFLGSTNDDFDFSLDRYLVVLNGSIALISYYVETTIFHISILGEVGVKESWTKLFIVGPLPCVYCPIGVGKNGDIFFRRKDYELVWFNLSTNMIEELGIKGENNSCQIGIYKENLISIE
ncbi:hypothetical protein AAZX31_03G175200 [Glycine max]|nr:hypothetical protein JHK87_007805 [Glycine soja]KAG5055683.1 hypothetical protein JHK85_008193 [Glycine max]KAH1258775.1 F-box protein CPR1 [Glycine max]